jgi:hypothetical protein
MPASTSSVIRPGAGHVRRADHVYPGAAQRFDRHRVPAEVVDQRNGGLASEHGRQVKLPVGRRHGLQPAERLDGMRAAAGVGEADDDVLALVAQRAALLEHGVRRS